LATCFDPTGSSSGLHYESNIVKKLHKFLESQTLFTIGKYEMFVSLDRLYTGRTAVWFILRRARVHKFSKNLGTISKF